MHRPMLPLLILPALQSSKVDAQARGARIYGKSKSCVVENKDDDADADGE